MEEDESRPSARLEGERRARGRDNAAHLSRKSTSPHSAVLVSIHSGQTKRALISAGDMISNFPRAAVSHKIVSFEP